MYKKIFLCLFLSVTALTIYPPDGFAYRPLVTEDAGVAGKGVVQMELGWDYLKQNGDREHVFLFVPIYGLTDRLEFSLEVPFLINEPEDEASQRGIGDINIVGKYLLVDEDKKTPALTLKGVIKWDNGDYDRGLGSGDKDYSLVAVASKSLGSLTMHAQLGYTWMGKEKDKNLRDIYLYGFALDFALTEAFHIVGELSGQRDPDRRENREQGNILVGAIYKISERFILDFAMKWGLTESSPDWSTTTGLSLTF